VVIIDFDGFQSPTGKTCFFDCSYASVPPAVTPGKSLRGLPLRRLVSETGSMHIRRHTGDCSKTGTFLGIFTPVVLRREAACRAVVGREGLEPSRLLRPGDFKSPVFTEFHHRPRSCPDSIMTGVLSSIVSSERRSHIRQAIRHRFAASREHGHAPGILQGTRGSDSERYCLERSLQIHQLPAGRQQRYRLPSYSDRPETCESRCWTGGHSCRSNHQTCRLKPGSAMHTPGGPEETCAKSRLSARMNEQTAQSRTTFPLFILRCATTPRSSHVLSALHSSGE
jgi:hypothetical protein